ncbi:MAG TPA: sugar phosphate nucleotidyltransferase, partial [Candidatus Melainabacteria bacterium]|nr:sugar phosphate nucleotidyltransferase [Candidatus Melainabacteria bacterium]
LKKHGFDEVIFTLFYLPDAIKDYFQDGSDLGIKVDYSVEEGKPLGTAGCVKAVQDKLDSTFLVISGDSLTDMDLTKALKFHKEKGSKATLILKRVESPFEYGLVITDNDDRIQRFLEKPGASEVFSDTANTGTYILEPEVLNYVVMGQEQDFSNDLFPLLLLRNEPMYGYTLEDDYWCDIGNLQMYRQAHKDLLEGKVDMDIDYIRETEKGVFVGDGTIIDPQAKVEGPVIIGNGCRIGAGAEIGPYSTIGDNVVIQDKVSAKQPVIWSNVYVGKGSKLRACVVCNNATVHDGAEILEGGIIGSNSSVGQDAVISPDVRVWPDKVIESGSRLLTSLVWGTKAPRTLFGAHGVRGLANVEITPEFAVNLAAAYGSVVQSGPVLLSRDYWPVSQMISRAISAGLVSVGIEVQNLEATPLPISRHYVKSQRAAGLIHIRVSQREPEKVMIEFFDSKGITVTKRFERKIETTFFKEDFPRCKPSDVGHISYPSRVREYYKQTYVERIKGQVFEEDTVPFCVMPGSNFTRVMHSGEI